jgi:hypothetical protein
MAQERTDITWFRVKRLGFTSAYRPRPMGRQEHGSVSWAPTSSNPSLWHCRRRSDCNLIFRGESVTPLTAFLVALYSIFIRSLVARQSLLYYTGHAGRAYTRPSAVIASFVFQLSFCVLIVQISQYVGFSQEDEELDTGQGLGTVRQGGYG